MPTPSPTRDGPRTITPDRFSQVHLQPGPEARDVVDVIRVGWPRHRRRDGR